MHTFNGKLVAIVQTTQQAGKLQLKVKGKGLKAQVLTLASNASK